MPRAEPYFLEFLIEGTQASLDELKKRVSRALGEQGLAVEQEFARTASRHFLLSISGSLDDVDACHLRLNKDFVSEHSCIRLRDEAGDEIRLQAYPILAHIEQRLRAFINRAMVEVEGFDWWDSLAPSIAEPRIRDGVQKVEEQIGKASAIHHPLELAFFDHLISIVTTSVQHWRSSKPLCTTDLLEVLSECSSIEELRQRLIEKARKISLWDEVFAYYFDEADAWNELADVLVRFVIPIRNAVMHHRPIHLWQLRKLDETRQAVDSLMTSALAELPEEERTKARRVSEEWSQALGYELSELNQLSPMINDIMESARMQQEELLRLARDAALSPRINDIVESARMQQEELLQLARDAALSPKIGDVVESARMQQELFQAVQDTSSMFSKVMEAMRQNQEELFQAAQDASSNFRYVMKTMRRQQKKLSRIYRPAPQLAASDTVYIASAGSNKFHQPTCPNINHILSDNRVEFASLDEAIAEGYMPCGICKPNRSID